MLQVLLSFLILMVFLLQYHHLVVKKFNPHTDSNNEDLPEDYSPTTAIQGNDI